MEKHASLIWHDLQFLPIHRIRKNREKFNNKNVRERVIDLDRIIYKFGSRFTRSSSFDFYSGVASIRMSESRRRITLSNKSIISLARGIKPRSKLQRVATSGQGCVCIFSVRQSGAISFERILNINHIDHFWIWIGKLYFAFRDLFRYLTILRVHRLPRNIYIIQLLRLPWNLRRKKNWKNSKKISCYVNLFFLIKRHDIGLKQRS